MHHMYLFFIGFVMLFKIIIIKTIYVRTVNVHVYLHCGVQCILVPRQLIPLLLDQTLQDI